VTHPRLLPSNGRVALKETGHAKSYVDGTPMMVTAAVCDLLRDPRGGLDCQLLRGAEFLVIEQDDDWAFGQALLDNYCGYVNRADLSDPQPATHRVSALASHVYSTEDMKSPTLGWLPFGARLTATMARNRFFALMGGGFVPAQHLVDIDEYDADFVSVFQRFAGIPYLWGGNSTLGMDCSGAVQLSMIAAGIACPRDTDMQVTAIGRSITPDEPHRRGDLVFWQGHVGVMCDPVNMIHSNAWHMAVAVEPLEIAAARIIANGGGAVTAFRRL